MNNDLLVEIGFFIVLGVPFAYLWLLPIIVANKRDAQNKGVIIFLTLFLGWSVVAWMMAMAMASSNPGNDSY